MSKAFGLICSFGALVICEDLFIFGIVVSFHPYIMMCCFIEYWRDLVLIYRVFGGVLLKCNAFFSATNHCSRRANWSHYSVVIGWSWCTTSVSIFRCPPALAAAYFPFVNGRCHLKRSMPFFSSELHSLGLRTQKTAVTGSCVSLVIWVRVRVRVLFRVRDKNSSSSLEIFGLFFFLQFFFYKCFFFPFLS